MKAIASTQRARDAALAEGVIQNLALFEGVGRPAVRESALNSMLVRLTRGEVILSRGERVPGLLALAYGSAKTRLRQPHGSEIVLRLLNPGDTFGEAPMLLGRESRVDALALADTMVVMVPAPWISNLLQRDARFARNMTRVLAERTHQMLAELEAATQPSARRLAAYLDSIAQPGAVPGTWTAKLPVSKTLLAARLGIKKETLSRLLREFVGLGLIAVAQRDITILDRERLDETYFSPGSSGA